MMKLRGNEEAVSPVIGVILMVAITVILAAVIAAFVFGMADTADAKPRNVAATAQLSGDLLVVTYQGGPDHGEVESVTCLVKKAGGGGDLVDHPTIPYGEGESAVTLKVGHKWSIPIVSGDDEGDGKLNPKDVAIVTVSATFEDGTVKVILDKNLRIP